MQIYRGTVEDILRGSSVFGAASKGTGAVSTDQMASFSVNGAPMEIRSKSVIPIKEGHEVIIAGKPKSNGQAKVIYLQNLTNGTSFKAYLAPDWGIGGNIFMMIFGVVFFFVIFPLALTLWSYLNIREVKKAEQMVQDAMSEGGRVAA